MITNQSARLALAQYVTRQSATTLFPVDPYTAFFAAGGRVTKCRASLRGMNRAVAVRCNPTRVVRSRG